MLEDLKDCLDKDLQKSLNKLSMQTTGKSISNLFNKNKTAKPKTPTFILNVDLDKKLSPPKNINSYTLSLPVIHNENSVSCSLITEKGLFPTNRKRKSWSDAIIFRDGECTITATSLTAKVNPQTGRTEEQSTNQSDLDVLYAILAHFGGTEKGQTVKIRLSSLRDMIGLSRGGKQRQWIKQSIDRIDGMSLRILKGGKSRKFQFFSEQTPSYDSDGSGLCEYVYIRLSEYVFDSFMIKPLFIPLKKRSMIKSLVGKWLFSYVCSRLPKPFDITIEEAIKRSGFIGEKCKFISKIKEALKQLHEMNICTGIISLGRDSKIIFIHKNSKQI